MKFKQLVAMSGTNINRLSIQLNLKPSYLHTIDNRDYKLMTLKNAKLVSQALNLTLDEFYTYLGDDSYMNYLEVWTKYRKKGEIPLTEQEWKLK